MKPDQQKNNRAGAVLAAVLILMLVVAVLTVTFYSLSAEVGIAVARDINDATAFWAAEAGIEQAKTLGQMKRKRYTQIPNPNGLGGMLWGTNVLAGTTSMGSYTVSILDEPAWDNNAHALQKYIITSVGRARGQSTNSVTIHARLLNYASNLHASHSENGVYFATGDTLDGPIYTDDRLHILGPPGPVFYQLASSATNSADYRLTGGGLWTPTTNEYNAVWQGGLALNAAPLDIQGQFGDHVTDIQTNARAGGLALEGGATNGYTFTFNQNGSVTYSNRSSRVVQSRNLPDLNGTIYVDQDVYVQGVVNGQVTLASRHSINIMGDLVFNSASGINPNPWSTNFNYSSVHDMLGLLAGDSVNVQGTNSINIHASILITTNGFNADANAMDIGNKFINLFGGMSQYSRGVIGHAATFFHPFQGFHKNYKFDQRYNSDAPPSFPPSVYLFSSWQQ